MPYTFVGENLVEVPAPEVTGYSWQNVGGQGADAPEQYRWVRNEGFDPNSILDIQKDQYGRTLTSLAQNASPADTLSYNLSRGYDPTDFRVATNEQTGISPDWENVRNTGWWNVDPAIQAAVEAEYAKNAGNAIGMTGWKDYIVPASILLAGAGTAIGTGALAGGATAGEAAGAGGAIGAGGSSASLPSLSWTAPEIGGSVGSGSTFGSLNAALPATGSVGGAGAGLSAQLAPGAVLGTGLNGGAIGGSYLAGANGMVATDFLGNAIPASSVGMGGIEGTGTSVLDALKTANQVRQGVSAANSIAKLLGGGTAAKTGLGTANQLASLLRPTAQTSDYLGQYKMNQNPFVFTPQGQTVASEGMYDVSGSNPMANALRKA